MHPNVDGWLSKEGADPAERRYFDDARAFLTSFIVGDDFDDPVKLKELKGAARGWFELRITFHPHHRIFGAFLRPGEFVALTQGARSRLDQNFAPSINRAQALWSAMFTDQRPLTAGLAHLLEDFDAGA